MKKGAINARVRHSVKRGSNHARAYLLTRGTRGDRIWHELPEAELVSANYEFTKIHLANSRAPFIPHHRETRGAQVEQTNVPFIPLAHHVLTCALTGN